MEETPGYKLHIGKLEVAITKLEGFELGNTINLGKRSIIVNKLRGNWYFVATWGRFIFW